MSNSQKIYEAFKTVMEKIKTENKNSKCNFFVERDLVWTVQQRLQDALDGKGCNEKEEYANKGKKDEEKYVVYNDYPIKQGNNRSECVDLAVAKKGIYESIYNLYKKEKSMQKVLNKLERETDDIEFFPVELAVEFKFEPKERIGVQPHKFPVVSPDGIKKDIERVQEYADTGKARKAVAILIDERRYHEDLYTNGGREELTKPSTWKKFKNTDISILWTEFSMKNKKEG